jgi:hypothetical protein
VVGGGSSWFIVHGALRTVVVVVALEVWPCPSGFGYGVVQRVADDGLRLVVSTEEKGFIDSIMVISYLFPQKKIWSEGTNRLHLSFLSV